ncbi:MAG TPA: amino acid permease [Acidimicrobiales bacterium]|nr:amino acid permease [Acidimicrobiales bacterium]
MSATGVPAVPESAGYRVKRLLLGPPLVTEQLASERLGKPTALAVLSSDVMSSSAYATEEILVVLFPYIGLAAFSLLVPITLAIIGVLVLVTLLYRQVVHAYPKAGGAYVVSRENLGPLVSQVAAAALLIDYTLTVAVSVAAGTAAITSAVPALSRATTAIGIGFVLLLAYGNLRGIREAGRSFAVPTFFFIANMAVLALVGTVRAALGHLHEHSVHLAGAVRPGHAGSGLFLGATLFIVLKAYASGGSALTGTEAISNGVSVFRSPQARNARQTLVWMAVILGSMFVVVSVFAALTHPVPYESGTPTVISQVGQYVYGSTGAGHFLYYMLQVGTAGILILAANTSFTGFPFLASFAAEDSFLPRQLMRRGHRLVFSNGIVVLTVVAVGLLLATNSNVNSLIALYAIGVFTGFTLSGAGMVRHHWVERGRRWRRNLAVCAGAGVLSAIVDFVFVVTKFTEGAWVVVVLLPLLVAAFSRLNRRYGLEAAVLGEGVAARAAEAPTLRRHTVLVLVDRLDLATARAIQYARTLNPDELRAVHFVLDTSHAADLSERWTRLGLSRLPLELVECRDRRLTRAVLELAAEAAADGETEVSVLLPRRAFRGPLGRVLHDQTADRIVEVVSQLPHVTATIVPFPVDVALERIHRRRRQAAAPAPARAAGPAGAPERSPRERTPGPVPSGPGVPGTVAISEVQPRRPAKVAGRIRAVRVQPFAGVPSLECTLDDDSGRLLITFMGRRRVPGIEPGARLLAEGVVGTHRGQPAILNPIYEILAPAEPAEVT